MNRDSLLPKSLFSASTLKLEPVEQTLSNTTSTTRQQAPKRRKSSSSSTIAPTAVQSEAVLPPQIFTPTPPPATTSISSAHDNKKRRINIFDSDEDEQAQEETAAMEHAVTVINSTSSSINNDSSSSSSSSGSEDEEEELEMQFARNGTTTQLNHAMNTLLIKLERQQARQNRYLDKVKRLNKAIKKTSRLVGYHANFIVESSSKQQQQQQQRHHTATTVFPSPVASPISATVKETHPHPQLAKRSTPFGDNESSSSRPKQRKVVIDYDEEDEVREVDVVIESSRDQALLPPSPSTATSHKKQAKGAARPQFPIKKVNHTRNPIIEIDFATRNEMDLYTVRQKNGSIMSNKKPRSLLYNIADSNSDMSELMITTSLDGELQFWNTRDRRKIKTIGQAHLYDTWIDDICWATPSTLAFNPPQKSKEPVKLVHINNVTKTNVEGRIQTLNEEPHENGVSVIASLDTGTYASRNSETCSFVTGGYDKSVYIWNLKRESPVENFTQNGVHRLNIKHTSAVYSLCYDKYRNILFSGGSDQKVVMFDMQSNTTIRELRLSQRVSQVIQSKANPNIMLITTTNRAEQFSIYDQRVPGFEGIKLKFGQHEEETLSRFIRPDMHENGYMVCCGGQGAPKLNFWDLRYTDVARGPSFSMDTQGKTRSLRSMFLPDRQDTIVSMSSSRYMTWIDYAVKKDEVVKSLT